MKKSLVLTLALVFVLGIAGTAFAANPFTDVPANHWAYASVSKLAQAGIVDGYGDGRFIGNNTMTRFEMAQIVAKAMAKVDSADAAQRAQIEKLAAEFADELDSLGVRVAKLEKNADNVKITGEARFSYYDYNNNAVTDSDRSELRSRIWLSGQVNDRWSYGAMLENKKDFKTNGREQDVSFRRAWVDGSIGVVDVKAGRFESVIMYGTLFDVDMDGIDIGYSNKKFNINVFAGRPEGSNPWFAQNPFFFIDDTYNQNYTVYGTYMSYGFTDKFNANFAYYNVDGSANSVTDADIFEIGVDYKFSDKFMMWAEYVRGDSPNGVDLSKNGWAAGMQYGQTERNEPGTWQLTAAYYDVPAMAAIAPTTELDVSILGDGFRGWTVGGSVMLAKNIDFNVDYFSLKNQDNFNVGRHKEKLLWSYVRFYF